MSSPLWCAVGVLGVLAAGCAGPQAPSAATGRALYQAYGCASCHGPDGRGDGPAAKATPRPPRDFHLPTPFRRGADLATVSQTIAAGISESGMPAYKQLNLEERNHLAAYLLSLQPPAGDSRKTNS